MNTNEILKAHAPELCEQYELADDLRKLDYEKRCYAELIETHAQTLVKLAEGEWKPIETAPRDGLAPGEGTLVDLWSNSQGRVANCFFDKADHKWVQRIYYYSPGKRLTQFREVTDPTHWKLLPKPPEKTLEGKQ